ncbi:MAG: 50S ribosomal protein L18 [candidate division Zixibacteria bacterium]|nr:50S ribosomal protein L18 [candidate division Zixibacteria bacterium]
MSDKLKSKRVRELRRRRHVRRRVNGTAERPRLTVCKSLRNTIAQLIDDEKGVTLAFCSTAVVNEGKVTKTQAAKKLGEKLGALALERGIKCAVFDRNHYIYHGRVKAVADGARGAGLEI